MRRNRKMDVDELIAAARRNFENEENPDEVFRLCEEVQKLSKGDLEKFRRSGYSEALAISCITALEMQKEGTWDAYVEKCRHRKRRNLEEIKRKLMDVSRRQAGGPGGSQAGRAKMNTYWSQYVQKTEELYLSRSLKFSRGNMARWIEAMGLSNGMKILEVGCAGGLLCHRLKECLPDAEITGLDFDTGHIEYAREKSRELGLPCRFIAGDAAALPFEEGTFDVCCSHTVMSFCDPGKFAGEQYRVLKPGGRMIVMDVCGGGAQPEEWVPDDTCEEKELFDKVWAAAADNPGSRIKRYESRAEKYAAYLAAQGFRKLSVDAVAAVKYAPDWDNVEEETARAQINEDRMSELCSVEKAYRMAPDALSGTEYETLIDRINRRYDRRIQQYENGEKSWEFRIATTVIISGEKP